MKYNLSNLDLESIKKMNVDLAASSIAFRERNNMPVSIKKIELNQDKDLRKYFYERIIYYRKISLNFYKNKKI